MTSAQISLQLRDAVGLLARKAYRDAHAKLLSVLSEAPQTAEAYYLLGLLTADHNNPAKALDLFERARRIDPAHAGASAQAARCQLALSRRPQASASVDAARTLDPGDAFTLDTIGVVLSRLGRHDEALPYYQRAVDVEPGRADYLYNLGAAQQFAGALEAAEQTYQRAIHEAPDETRAQLALVQIRRQTRNASQIEKLEADFDRLQMDADHALRLGHALAKVHDDLGEAEAALAWLDRAKSGKRDLIKYDAAADAALFDAGAQSAQTDYDAPGRSAAAPIFITGMPRTGTTLVDRILSAHSQIRPAGELTEFALALKRAARTPSNLVLDPATLNAAAQMDLNALGQAYIDSVCATLSIDGRFTDKMPLNIFLAPVILAALPKARVICLRRHPADTVLSNYRQMFATSFSYYNYAYALETAADYYIGFDRMVRAFEETLPSDRFTVIHYEKLVTDFEPEVRRLIAFCDLPFEAACLAFHENQAPVATASSAQVREPLYQSALARWKRYEIGLAPALDRLEAAGCLKPGERQK